MLPDGSRVRKGNITGFVPYSMGRMTKLWGDDALEFKPERWLKDGIFQPEPLFKFTAFQVKFCKFYCVISYLALLYWSSTVNELRGLLQLICFSRSKILSLSVRVWRQI